MSNSLIVDHFLKNEIYSESINNRDNKIKFMPLIDDEYVPICKDKISEKNKKYGKTKKNTIGNINHTMCRDNKYREMYDISEKLYLENKNETENLKKNKKTILSTTKHAITLTEWTNKYTPKKISDLLFDIDENVNIEKKNINNTTKKIVEWLNKYKNKDDHNIKKKYKKTLNKTTKTKKNNKIIKYNDEDETSNYDDDEIMGTIYENENESEYDKIKNTNKNSLLILGNHGVGKTCMINTILNELGYRIYNFNFNIIKNTKNIREELDKIAKGDVLDAINGIKSKIVIMIDKLESITSNLDKKTIISIIKTNEKHKICPIILLSNNKHRKILFDLRKICYELIIHPPSNDELTILLKKICNNEGIYINDNNVKTIILNHCQNDFRRMLNLMYDVVYVVVEKNNEITTKLIEEYCNISREKDIDFILFNISEEILYKYDGLEFILNQHEKEKTLLPLMMHEHYLNIMKQRHKNTNMKKTFGYSPEMYKNNISSLKFISGTNDINFNKINKISTVLSYGDIIENNIYGDQLWDIQELHGFYSCVMVSYLLNNDYKYGKQNYDNYEVKFITDLNKTSLKNINKKNISSVVNIDKLFTNMEIYDYLNMCQILQYLINMDKIDECREKIDGYNIKKIEQLELLLKMDKICYEKINIKSKYKEQIKKLLL